jgi:uncharacterized membrane protein
MSEQDGAPKNGARTGMRRWVKLLLAASLALNLAVIGLAAGAALRHAGQKKNWHRPPDVGAMIFRELDRDTRRKLRQEAGGPHGSYVQRRHAEAERVIAILRKDTFDAEALLAELRQQADARHDFHLKLQNAWVRKLAEMAPKERQDFADRVAERFARGAAKRP